MTNGVFIKIDDFSSQFWLAASTPKYWIATHMHWNLCKASTSVRKEDLEKYKWIPLSSKELVWWEDE